MNSIWRFNNMLFVGLVFSIIQTANAYDYYCPRSDLLWKEGPTENGNGKISSKFGGIDEPFPKSEAELEKHPKSGWTVFKLKDCSTEDFMCSEVDQYQSRDLYKKFFLFLPRTIEAGKEYKFRKMTLVTQVAAITPYMRGGQSKTPIIQATIWQTINDKSVPIKLTVESGRGVVYWDGLDFWSERFNSGELCILQSEKGIFPSVEIKDVLLRGGSTNS